jgi:hypothetical protein
MIPAAEHSLVRGAIAAYSITAQPPTTKLERARGLHVLKPGKAIFGFGIGRAVAITNAATVSGV